MKTACVTFIFIALFTGAGVANAKSCSANARTEILDGLKKLSVDSSQSEEKQQEAVFARSLIINNVGTRCDFNSGFAGSVYDLATTTHRIHISFAGKTITNLLIERVSFN